MSVPMTHPPSHAATPLMHNTSVTGKEGSAAQMKLMSQPHWLESATASPELPSGSSQEDGPQLGQTNENSQSSGSSLIHGMTLKYSDEVRGVALVPGLIINCCDHIGFMMRQSSMDWTKSY